MSNTGEPISDQFISQQECYNDQMCGRVQNVPHASCQREISEVETEDVLYEAIE